MAGGGGAGGDLPTPRRVDWEGRRLDAEAASRKRVPSCCGSWCWDTVEEEDGISVSFDDHSFSLAANLDMSKWARDRRKVKWVEGNCSMSSTFSIKLSGEGNE